jgi:hypothetical protein
MYKCSSTQLFPSLYADATAFLGHTGVMLLPGIMLLLPVLWLLLLLPRRQQGTRLAVYANVVCAHVWHCMPVPVPPLLSLLATIFFKQSECQVLMHRCCL